ncbi:MAG: UDP-3-O-(3-hydroxymyristoyl)glucosamine N-acyltransferase [Alphaproteobacteria bacterium]
MADNRFFSVSGPFDLAELARRIGATLSDPSCAGRYVRDVAPLDSAGPEDLSFLDNRRYVEAFAASRAGVCVVAPEFKDLAPAGMVLLLSSEPYRAYARAAQAFYPEPPPVPFVHPSAVIAPNAILGAGSEISAGAVIGAGAILGARCRVGPNAVVGDCVTIGDDTTIGANASLSHCLIGSRVVIYAGARIGQPGFGFAMGKGGVIKVPQLGRVIVEDDVEIGANSTVDRGSGPDTVIGAGTMIDNLVQIGHNVRVGKYCVLVAQSGVSGSTRIGDGVMIAGQSGVVGHLTIGKGARIGAQSGVTRDVADGATVMGSPAMPIKQFFRGYATLQRLAEEKGK